MGREESSPETIAKAYGVENWENGLSLPLGNPSPSLFPSPDLDPQSDPEVLCRGVALGAGRQYIDNLSSLART